MPVKTISRKPREQAIATIKSLSNDASYNDIMYELYVLQKIENGEEDIKAGRTYTSKEAKKRLGKWLK